MLNLKYFKSLPPLVIHRFAKVEVMTRQALTQCNNTAGEYIELVSVCALVYMGGLNERSDKCMAPPFLWSTFLEY
jgi:hypothetical protein